jgi:tryptophan-rich sensory protein
MRVFQQPGPNDWGSYPGSSAPVSPTLALVGFIGLCLLVGASGGTITAHSMEPWYASLAYPPLTPPNWLFAPAWAVLYIMLGISGWMVWHRKGASRPLRLWGWQLAANALWVPAFFGLHSPRLGLAVMAVMLALIVLTIRAFRRVSIGAGWMMTPYAVWCVFAAYLNVGFCILNPS